MRHRKLFSFWRQFCYLSLFCPRLFLPPSMEDGLDLSSDLCRRFRVVDSPAIFIIYLFPITCTRVGNKKKSSQFKRLDNQVGLIFRLALPEELEWENRAEDVALSLDSIKRCLINMLTALDRDTPQTKDGLIPHFLPQQEPNTFQKPPWLWFTLPELGFPLLTDEYHRPIHPEIEEYMRRHVSDDQQTLGKGRGELFCGPESVACRALSIDRCCKCSAPPTLS